MSTNKTKKTSERVSVRIRKQSKDRAKTLLAAINKKPFGRKVKLDHVLEFAIGLIAPEHIKVLQEQSMTNENRKEILRQKYIETFGTITADEFTGFMLTPKFVDFLKDHGGELKAA